MLCIPTKVAAVNCHAVSPEFRYAGSGMYGLTSAKNKTRPPDWKLFDRPSVPLRRGINHLQVQKKSEPPCAIRLIRAWEARKRGILGAAAQSTFMTVTEHEQVVDAGDAP